MNGCRLLGLVLAIGSFSVGVATAQLPTQDHVISAGGIDFRLPAGLTIQKVADESLIRWPIVADWDRQGRLVVAESGGVGWPIQEHNQKELHKIVRLVDRDGDGIFDSRLLAADKLAFPEGVLCLGDDILVAAPPVIWRLSDRDGDGFCEDREVWFDGGTVTNCANDLHGPYLGRDGWIYWCKGAFGRQSHTLLDGSPLTSSAAHIYRRKVGGGPIEPVIGGGMDNPVEVAFTPEGEMFFTSTFLQHPRDGKRDGIAHAVYGAVFGKDHHVVDSLPRTGPLMTAMTHLGPAAPSGLICPESPSTKKLLGYDRDARLLLAALFNLHKLTVHELIADGASYRTSNRDLVATDRVDFHPTDVIEDADGSLLLIDTGGWYDLCCPTSRVDQRTADGGIYRISSLAGEAASVSRSGVDWADDAATAERLVDTLFDPRPWMRREASRRLKSRGHAVHSPLVEIATDSGRPLDQRQTAIWALCRFETTEANAAVAEMLVDAPVPITLAALQVVSLHRYAPAKRHVESLLWHDSARVRRVAASALGRIGDWDSARLILNACEGTDDDRHLHHALLHALIEIGRRQPSQNLVEIADSDAKLAAALVVHQQLDRGIPVDPDRLLAALESEHLKLRSTAAEVLADRPELAPLSTMELSRLWRNMGDSIRAPDGELLRLLSAWKEVPEISRLVADWLQQAASWKPRQQVFLAENLGGVTPATLSGDLMQAILGWTENAAPELRQTLLQRLAEATCDGRARELLAATITRRARECDEVHQQLRWMAALPIGHPIDPQRLESLVLRSVLSDDPSLSSLAAAVLARIALSETAAMELAQSLDRLTPRQLTTAIEAIHQSGQEQATGVMLNLLVKTRAARTLPDGYLVNLFRESPAPLRQQAAQTARDIARPAADVQAAVSKTLAQLPAGDPVRGLQIFRSEKAACSACHRMGYIGNNIGPELTRIGGSRTREALVEAILFPSSRLEQSYQSTRVVTAEGKIYNGLIRRRGDAGIELQIEADRVIKIAGDDIEVESPSDISIMPSGLVDVLKNQELADLLALLEAAK